MKLTHLFSRKVFALDTFFPIAEAFQEKYEPDGSTYNTQNTHIQKGKKKKKKEEWTKRKGSCENLHLNKLRNNKRKWRKKYSR